MNSLDYIEVSVRLSPFSQENAEIAEAEIADLPFSSFVMEAPLLKCYISKDLFNQGDLKVVLSGLDFVDSFSVALIPFQNWNIQWESEFKPILVDNQVTVVKDNDSCSGDDSKEDPKDGSKGLPHSRFTIRIRPEMAFGTGHHQTTFMMIRAMLRNESVFRDATVLDMGCGTGVLGILAAKMRARKVVCIDIDLAAAHSAFNNARINRVGRRVETCCGDASLIQSGSNDVVLANIHRNTILEDLKTYAGSLRPGGIILTSGFYSSAFGPDTLPGTEAILGSGHCSLSGTIAGQSTGSQSCQQNDDVTMITKEAVKQGLTPIYSDTLEGWACLGFRKNKTR